MIGVIVLTFIGMIIWVLGLYLISRILFEDAEFNDDKVQGIFFVLVIAGFLGGLFNAPSCVCLSRDLTTTYVQPTHILKTNNVTVISHIVGTELYSMKSTESIHWNSTNIMAKITSGKNLWGVPVASDYSFVIYDNKIEK